MEGTVSKTDKMLLLVAGTYLMGAVLSTYHRHLHARQRGRIVIRNFVFTDPMTFAAFNLIQGCLYQRLSTCLQTEKNSIAVNSLQILKKI